MIREPDAVAEVAFAEGDAFGGDGGVQVAEYLVEEGRHKEEGGALVEALMRLVLY